MRGKEDKPVVACRISERRVSLRLSQLRASEILGIPRSTYAGYESGQREPNLDMLHKIAETYRTSVDYLVGRTDDPTFRGTDSFGDDMKAIMKRRLHWGGVPLTEEDKKPIIELLDLVIRERLKYQKLQEQGELESTGPDPEKS